MYYRGITWTSNRDLSEKLGMSHSYVGIYLHKGKTHEEIIDYVLDKYYDESLKRQGGKTRMAKVVARFEKVSYNEFKKAWAKAHNLGKEVDVREIYDNIKLPERSTKRSSGYDFFYPGDVPTSISKGKSRLIPTGIRCVFLEDGYDLSIYPRSGMGFEHRVHLDNTVGIIDNDYFEADNEGHIMIKLSCDSRESVDVIIKPRSKFAQGIIREFFLAEGDDKIEKENRGGGMGSTGV